MNENTKARIKMAEERALESLDYILETFQTPDFVEVVGRMGGDTVTYRIYDDGSMYERQDRQACHVMSYGEGGHKVLIPDNDKQGTIRPSGLRPCTDWNGKEMDTDGKIKQRAVCGRV